jgi:hypothetical protein
VSFRAVDYKTFADSGARLIDRYVLIVELPSRVMHYEGG